MTDWRSHIQQFHDLDYEDSPGSLVLGPPATEQAIADLEKELNFTFPEEFRSFYLTCDGFGTSSEDGTDWFFLPLADIAEHTFGTREWFEKTHPDIASSFVAFVDWGNGDASGYLFDGMGSIRDGIFMFEHESYDSDEAQKWEEFLMPIDESIQDFLTS